MVTARISGRFAPILIGLVLVSVLWPIGFSIAGQNPDTRLCMHLIATESYLDDLYSEALAELVLGEINQDLDVAEIAASSYSGYCILCAWNISGISGIEFVVEGWPTTRGAPPYPTIQWEDSLNTVVTGVPFYPGALASWGGSGNGCDQTDTHARLRPCETGQCLIYPFAYFRFDLSSHVGEYPISLNYGRSPHTYPEDPHIYVTDCTKDLAEDTVPITRAWGCIIGGYSGSTESCTWSAVKVLYRDE